MKVTQDKLSSRNMAKDGAFGEKIAADGIFSRQTGQQQTKYASNKKTAKDKSFSKNMTRNEVLGEKIAADGIFSRQTAAGKISSKETAKDGDPQENGKR